MNALGCMSLACAIAVVSTSSTIAETNMTPTRVLEKEHDVIEKVARATLETARQMRTTGQVDTNRIEKIHTFFVNFADACHHAKEEGELFPLLRDLGGDPVILDLLIKQHEEGRSLLAGVRTELDRLTSGATDKTDRLSRYLYEYAILMPRHIDTENHHLWPEARASLSPSQKQRVAEAFHRIETEELGEGFHEQYHGMALEILGKTPRED